MVERKAWRAVARLFGVLGLWLAWAAAGGAAPSGLNVIPTADILPPGSLSLEGETTGTRAPLASGGDRFALLQAGVTPRLEIGVDREVGDVDQQPLFNVKWLLLPDGSRAPALALGVQNVARGAQAETYLVATRSFGKPRLHLGALHSPDTVRLLAGVDVALGNRITFQADHTGGGDGLSSVGLALQLGPRASLTYALLFPAGDAHTGHLLNLALAFGG